MRQGDDAWLNIVRWSLSAMIEAEEYGITSKNVDDLAKNSANPNIKRILGVTAGSGAQPGAGRKMGLPDRQAGGQLR